MKRKRRAPLTPKGSALGHKPYPDNDPEWEHLEERYSQINDEMKKLAELLESR